MKQRITILAMLFTVLSFAQTTVHNTKVKMKVVNTGVVSDSLLVIAPNDEIRKIPRSVFLQGVEVDLSDYYTQTEISNILGNYAIGDHTNNANELADGSVSNTEYQYINSLTSNAQGQLDSKLGNTGAQTISIGGNTTVDPINQPNGSVVFGNYAGSILIPTINLKTHNGYGIMQASTADMNTYEDYSFSIRDLDGNDYTDLTKGGFTWVRYSTQLMKLSRAGDLEVKESVTAKEFKTTNFTLVQVGSHFELQFNNVTIVRFKSDGTIEATDFKIGL